MDRGSIFGLLIFVLFLLGILNLYYSEVVDVHLCTNKEGLTTYVSKFPPSPKLKVGTCEETKMTNFEVHNLRASYKRMYNIR